MYEEQDYVCSITPTEFELFCKEILEGYAETENLNSFTIDHNVKLKGYDGIYQIDVYATFVAVGVQFKIICECKQYKNHVNREKVVVLGDKVKSLGAHKGILLSTSGFQSGAIQYAKAHGIALIQVFDSSCKPYSFSAGPGVVPDENDPFMYVYNHWPTYSAINCTTEDEFKKSVYPKRSTVHRLYDEQARLMQEYSYNIRIPRNEGEQESK